MGIIPIIGVGVNRARVVCDDCGRADVVTCDYTGPPGRKRDPNEGQIIRKITAQGWSFIKHKLRCPACEAKRKSVATRKKETPMQAVKNNAAEGRKPSPEQEVDIIVTLSAVYDRKKKRYSGKETDRSVAEVVGGGCMPGWVSMIREDKFGPAGNEELDALRAELAHVKDCITMVGRDLEVIIRDAVKTHSDTDKRLRTDLATLEKRIDACASAHDKRVRA